MAKDEMFKNLEKVINEAKGMRMAAEDAKTQALEDGYNSEVLGRADVRIADCNWFESQLQNIVSIYKCID